VTRHQRLHREQDPRVRRSLAAALACAAVLVLGALVVVGLRVQQVHLGYELDRLKSERTRLEQTVRQLEIEMATLRSPGRVESRARELGLISPVRGQVRLAREYVAGSTGLAAERSRTASLSGLASGTTLPGPRAASDGPLSGHLRPDPASRHPLQR
jgi:cell division protein FtsL